ncbi:MAG: hypothetical protein ACI9JM_002779 [Halioglobus sp.]|jgi:hypothetical protein
MMNKTPQTDFPRYDSLPWHRQFWPWFIISLLGSVVLASLSLVYLANRHADDLVVDDYYKNGLAINQVLGKTQRAASLGLAADFSFSPHTVTVLVTGRLDSENLNLRLSHPLEADRDFAVSLVALEAGHFTGPLESSIAARWHWTLESLVNDGWRLDGVVGVKDIQHARNP